MVDVQFTSWRVGLPRQLERPRGTAGRMLYGMTGGARKGSGMVGVARNGRDDLRNYSNQEPIKQAGWGLC